MQTKFKVGDKVRCNSPTHAIGVNVGGIYTIKTPAYRYWEGSDELSVLLVEVDSCPYQSRFELVEPNPVLTPEEVFEHLRKGTKLQWCCRSTLNWLDHSGELHRIKLNELIDYGWRIKPEPEVIELNGKRYKLIEE